MGLRDLLGVRRPEVKAEPAMPSYSVLDHEPQQGGGGGGGGLSSHDNEPLSMGFVSPGSMVDRGDLARGYQGGGGGRAWPLVPFFCEPPPFFSSTASPASNGSRPASHLEDAHANLIRERLQGPGRRRAPRRTAAVQPVLRSWRAVRPRGVQGAVLPQRRTRVPLRRGAQHETTKLEREPHVPHRRGLWRRHTLGRRHWLVHRPD